MKKGKLFKNRKAWNPTDTFGWFFAGILGVIVIFFGFSLTFTSEALAGEHVRINEGTLDQQEALYSYLKSPLVSLEYKRAPPGFTRNQLQAETRMLQEQNVNVAGLMGLAHVESSHPKEQRRKQLLQEILSLQTQEILSQSYREWRVVIHYPDKEYSMGDVLGESVSVEAFIPLHNKQSITVLLVTRGNS
jgi:hypothetical protein